MANKSILIIDDDLELQETLKLFFEFEKFEVRCVNNGTEGLIELQKHPPRIILLDLMMPVMNGFQFIEAVQNLPDSLKRIPIVVLTAADRSMLSDPILKKVKFVFEKPFDISKLVQLISRQLEVAPGELSQ